MIARMPNCATMPASRPMMFLIMEPKLSPFRRVENTRMMKSCTQPAKTAPMMIHSVPGR